jgi:hypothetical protein
LTEKSMKMYRAVPKADFDPSKTYKASASRRAPSNVPYLVDNVWEFLRPDHAPSRRHSTYASPTPELALANASAVGADPSLYVVCEIVANVSDLCLAHLQVTDARLHEDIGRIVRYVAKAHGGHFTNMPLEQKAAHAALYLPGVSADELRAYFNLTLHGQDLMRELKKRSTFWRDASYSPQSHNGELFFELKTGGRYRLKPL